MTKNTLIASVEVERDYGFIGIRAIVDTESNERLLIEDGFGGMDSLEGACVRWRHGSAFQLLPTDTFETFNIADVIQQNDPARPYLLWDGFVVEKIAYSVSLN